MEIFKHNLAIEPDVQIFTRLALSSVGELGGNPFSASIAMLEITNKLRDAGAGSGLPLPVSVVLDGLQLSIEVGDSTILLSQLREQPKDEVVHSLMQRMHKSTEVANPEVLLRRNQEMMRYLDETKARTERELAELQSNLDARQKELRESIKQAETDALTGLFNRRAYDIHLEGAFRRAMRQRNEPLSLILFDLDFFKEINDTHGHQYGDAYLNKMAQSMLSVIRHDVDIAFRFGGDEFAMLLMADSDTASKKAQTVLSLMNGKVSIGINSIEVNTPDTLSLEDFVHHADDALYDAKRNGRGQVVCYGRGRMGGSGGISLVKAAAA